MKQVLYNIKTLSEACEIDVGSAERNFGARQAFFDALTGFAGEGGRYLREYTPSVVIFSDDVRADFLQEVQRLQSKLIALGMITAASEMNSLNEAVGRREPLTLSDALLEFYAKMDIISKGIASARVPDAAPPREWEKPVILVADEKPDVLNAITAALKGQYRVITASTKNAAAKAIEKHTPALFLLDAGAPEINGVELATLIRVYERFDSSPVLFLGDFDDDEAKRRGGDGCISEPVDKEVLLGKIAQYLAEQK